MPPEMPSADNSVTPAVASGRRAAIDLLGRSDRGREMGQLARINAKKKFCANDVIPSYERYYQRVLSETRAASA